MAGAYEAYEDVPFPFLFGGAFIEAFSLSWAWSGLRHFPSFSEGLSLRLYGRSQKIGRFHISLPFRRGFH